MLRSLAAFAHQGAAAAGAMRSAGAAAYLHGSAAAATSTLHGSAAATAAQGSSSQPVYLVTCACGQIGAEFVPYLRSKLGASNVIASDVKATREQLESGPFAHCDVQDKRVLARIIVENGVTHVVHLATLLSAVGERNPELALRVNTVGIQNVLDLAVTHRLSVYAPSTIAVFGASTPRINTPDHTVMRPGTMYGITKVHQELLGQYYADRYGVDYRSLRYPGIVSALSLPGGGTTDYAVDIFHAALRDGQYSCFLSPDAALPMMYMPDCLDATWQLMNAPKERLTQTTYNVTAMSFTPQQLADAIQAHLPAFRTEYKPDFRDGIARTWPASIDDSLARQDWEWRHRFGVGELVADMLAQLGPRYSADAPAAAKAAAV